MRKLLVLILFCLVTKTHWSQTFLFNSKGSLLAPPSPTIRNEDDVTIKVTSNKNSLKKSRIELAQRMGFVSSLINETHPEWVSLSKKRASLLQFLSSSAISAADCQFELIQQLEKVGICLTRDDIRKTIQKQPIDTITLPCSSNKDCACLFISKKFEELIDTYIKINDWKQRKNLTIQLLCDINEQERLNYFDIDTSHVPYISFKRQDSTLFPAKVFFDYTYKANNVALELESSSRKNDSVYTYSTELEFDKKVDITLVRINSIREAFISWHNKAASGLNREYLEALHAQVKKSSLLVDSLSKVTSGCGSPCPDQKNLTTLLNELKQFDTVWCTTNPVARWLKQWLWYSNGNFRLNYEGLTSMEQLKRQEKDFKMSQVQLSQLNELNEKLKNLKKCTSCTYTSFDSLKMIHLREDSISLVLETAQLEKKKKDLDEALAALSNFTKITDTLHIASVPLQQNWKYRKYTIYHDMQNNFEVIKPKIVLPDSYTVYYAFYNATRKAGDFTLTEEQEKFDDGSKAMREINAAFTTVAEAAAPLLPFASQVYALTAAIIGDHKIPKTENLKQTDSTGSQCSAIKTEIAEKLWRYLLLRQMLEQYEKNQTPGALEVASNDGSKYYTYSVQAKEFELPYTNKRIIKKDEKEVYTGRFSIGRQKNLTVGAGILFNREAATQVAVDTAGNNFTIKTSDSKAKYVIGLKFFPFKTFEADGGLIPRYVEKRFSIFGGFEITQPLANLYLGLGYDIVPGLQVGYGWHFYKRDYYKIQNNQIVDRTSSYKKSGGYYGVTIDPIVLTGILKSLFTK